MEREEERKKNNPQSPAGFSPQTDIDATTTIQPLLSYNGVDYGSECFALASLLGKLKDSNLIEDSIR